MEFKIIHKTSRSKNVVIQDIKVQNSPAWTVHPYFSEALKFLDMNIQNPYDSSNTDGINPEFCKVVDIVGVRISVVDDIHLSNVAMDGVITNFVINMYYFCDPDGKSEYVYSKKALPVDEMTPAIKHLTFTDVICRNSEVAAAFFYGLPESPIEEIKMKNIIFVFKEDS